MDHALSRTRRNLIGLSVILALMSAFGWDFPASMNILGNDITANPTVIRVMAWTAFAYLIFEYFVHLQPHFSAYGDYWKAHFMEYSKPQVDRRISEIYNEAKRVKVLKSKNVTADPHNSVIHSTTLGLAAKSRFAQNTNVKIVIRASCPGQQPKDVKISHPHEAPYIKYWRPWLKTSFRLLFLEPKFFEYMLPVLFPLLALGITIAGPFDLFAPHATDLHSN